MNIVNVCNFYVTNTPGTGSITVGSAVPGPFRTLGAAHDGMSLRVAFYDGSAFEIAKNCVYTHSTTTLTRGTLEDSTTGTAISLSNSTVCAVVESAGQLEPLNSINFTNLGTASVPIWQMNANILPRTDTLANLKALVSGGGEISSATDTPALVQLNGTAGSGTTAVFSPMAPGVWTDSTYTLSVPTPTASDTNANTLTIIGGAPTGNALGGDVVIKSSPGLSAAGSPATAGSVRITGAPGITGSYITGGHVIIKGGSSGFSVGGGDVTIDGGAHTATDSSTTGTTVNLTGGSNAATNGNGGIVNITGGPTSTGTGTGGDVIIKGGTKPASGTAGRVYLKDSVGNILMSIGGTNSTLSFYGVTPVTKPAVTGSRGGNAALASLLTQLAALGLITDSSSA